jgi:hypothetical protein
MSTKRNGLIIGGFSNNEKVKRQPDDAPSNTTRNFEGLDGCEYKNN